MSSNTKPKHYTQIDSATVESTDDNVAYNAPVFLLRSGGVGIQLPSGASKILPEISSSTQLHLVPAESSTCETELPVEVTAELSAQLEESFKLAREIEFEDGKESAFSRRLVYLVVKHRETAIKLLSGIILSRQTNSEVASEALRWIGHLYDPKSFRYRLWLLSNALKSGSVRVRDGAFLGLSFMDTTRAIPALRTAVEIETCDALKADILELLEYLDSRASQNSGKTS